MQKIFKYMLLAASISAMLAMTGCSSSDDNGSDSALGVYNVRQIVAENNKTARTIMWNSKAKQSDYNLEIRQAGSKASGSYKAKDFSFKDGKSNYIQYSVAVDGLQTGSSYEYRVNNGNAKGNWHKLTADKGDKFKALVFPDTQCSDYSHWQKLSKEAFSRNKNVDFYINMGDLVDNGEHQYQWQEWFKGTYDYNDSIPQAPLIGNHETYTLDWKVRYPEAYVNLFNVPENGLPQYKHQFYSFDYGPVHFSVLDSNYDKEMKEMQPNLRQEQLAWLEQDLAKVKAKWKVVLMHKDVLIYQFSKDSGRAKKWDTHFTDIGKDTMPIFEKHKVDAVLTAHLHTYRRRVPLLNFAPNPKGITYILTGVAGNVQYAKLWDDWENDAARAPYPETMNYLTMEADGEKLKFECFQPDGKKVDEVEIRK